MATTVYKRGSSIIFSSSFVDVNGNVTDPSSANISITYADGSGGLTTVLHALVGVSHVWSYTWDTRHIADGRVDWHVETTDTPALVDDGTFILIANLANLSVA